MTALILASQSASRAALLTAAGIDFDVRPALIDETAVKQAMWNEQATAADTAFMLAGLKAYRVRATSALVLAADQLLVCDGMWFDKPPTLAAARDQLQALRGKMHELVTAVVIFHDGQEIWRHLAMPRLRMRDFSDGFLEEYLAAEGVELLTTVGAYRLEARGITLFEQIEGSHSAILGLPLLPVLEFLRQRGVLRA